MFLPFFTMFSALWDFRGEKTMVKSSHKEFTGSKKYGDEKNQHVWNIFGFKK